MTRAALAIAFTAAACGRDVRLGNALEAAADAPIVDASGNPFAAGGYAMAFLDPPEQSCMGSLTGDEASFVTITLASLGLVGGAVTFATPTATSLTITGPPIATAVNQASLTLVPNVNSPPGVWDGLVTGDSSAGPLSTMRTATDLAAASTTATGSSIEAQLSVLYTTLDGAGACSVTFGVTFTPQ